MSLPCATNLNKPRHILIWPRRLHNNYFLTCENSIVWCLSLLWLSSWIVCYVHAFHFVFAMCVGFRGIKWPECKCLSHCIRWYNVRIQTVCKMAEARSCGGVDVVLPGWNIEGDGWLNDLLVHQGGNIADGIKCPGCLPQLLWFFCTHSL